MGDFCQENRFNLVFDERVDGPQLTELLKEKDKVISKYILLRKAFLT